MDGKRFKVGDIVEFGAIRTKVVKSIEANGCCGCQMSKLCSAIFNTDASLDVEEAFNELTQRCTAVDENGDNVSICFAAVE